MPSPARFHEITRCAGVDEGSTPPGMIVPFGGTNVVMLETSGMNLEVKPANGAIRLEKFDGRDIARLIRDRNNELMQPGVDDQVREAYRPGHGALYSPWTAGRAPRGDRLTRERGMAIKGDRSDPVISLPEGGGAIRGLGETFQHDPFTGTATWSVPIAVTPGRGGFGPELVLRYSSGTGNGSFGLGWDLALPRVSRRTELGAPRYDDRDGFVLSGAEDLVPLLGAGGPETLARGVRPEALVADDRAWLSERQRELAHWRSHFAELLARGISTLGGPGGESP